MSFIKFAKLVHSRYEQLAKSELFVAGNGDDVWRHYLASFPEGTNPIYKTNTEHDCNCCKNFVRNLGNAVAIVDGKVLTVWNIPGAPEPYATVAKALDTFVQGLPIVEVFRTTEGAYGAEKTHQQLEEGGVKVWNHFHGAVSAIHRSNSPGQLRGEYASAVQVFRRGLEELAADAIETVIDLIDGKALYRGEEHLAAVKAFRSSQNAYKKLTGERDRELFVWAYAKSQASRFRNTVIGTLVQDLSEGVELERAVRSFEQKVAPTNYKRPTALITPGMIKDAMKTIEELGLSTALQRRYARISDVSVNNVLWVNNSTKAKMRDGLEELLMSSVGKSAVTGKPEPIGIDEFMTKVLPGAASVEMMLTGQHMPNFMSLTAPVHADSGKLFKWSNDFAWSYDGNITDSIKEKVKAAGGNVTNAKLRCSLAWTNYDDLDIHVSGAGGELNFYNKRNIYGALDVDMNAGRGGSRTPVENVSFTRVPDGEYRVNVNQYCQRETTDVGCVVEIECEGKIVQLSHPQALKGMKLFATIKMRGGKIEKLTPGDGIVAGGLVQDKWGVQTEKWSEVDTVMFSPNYWDGNATGNKHWFFILNGCKNPDPTRGIYNEFLHPELEKHRKVFEVLGDKTKCQPTDDQLSGVGFSSTKGDSVTVRVAGPKINKAFTINF